MNDRLIVGEVGVNEQLGEGKGDPSTRLGRRVEGYGNLLYGQRVIAGSEAQLWDDEAYSLLQSCSLSFPEVEILASHPAKPLRYGRPLIHIRTSSLFPAASIRRLYVRVL